MAEPAESADYAAAHAEAAKKRGNEHFKRKEYKEAVEAFSEAIALDPENHVLYSNRSGAYLAMGDALGRFASAQASYLRALELDNGNATFEAGLAAAKEGEVVDAARRKAEARHLGKQNQAWSRTPLPKAEAKAEYEERMAALRAAEAERVANEEASKKLATASLDDFFAAVSEAEEAKQAAKRAETNPITEKYATQKLGTSAENVDRLTRSHAKWRNLNPYSVLMLDTDATDDDVKMRYRKLSALCHPDKNMGNDKAREAFEAVKDASQLLGQKKERDRLVIIITNAKKNFYADRLAQLDKGIAEATLEPEEPALEKALMKVFAQNEVKRIDTEEHTRINNERERQQEEEKKKKELDEAKFEEQWNQDDRRSERLNFWQEFQDDAKRVGVQKRARTARNFKQEEHQQKKKKHGEADMNSWKKDWK